MCYISKPQIFTLPLKIINSGLLLGIDVARQYELNGAAITNGTDDISDEKTQTCLKLAVDGCYSYMQVTCSVYLRHFHV